MSQNSHMELATSEDSQPHSLELKPQGADMSKKVKNILLLLSVIMITILAIMPNKKASSPEYILTRSNLPISSQTKERIAYGQPRPRNHFIKAVIIKEIASMPNSRKPCVFTNGINIISKKTIETARNFLEHEQIDKWIVFLPLTDNIGDQLLANLMNSTQSRYFKEVHELEIDSNYKFITERVQDCQSIIYLQNNFIIDAINVKKFINATFTIKTTVVSDYMAYSAYMKNPYNVTNQLQNLQIVDLSTVKEQKFSEYVFIFDTKFLNITTPLNFVNFNKYTLEQMIIFPILAITQSSKYLIPIKTTTHMFDTAVVQFKQFQLKGPIKKSEQMQKTFCFLALPMSPDWLSLSELQKYVKNLAKIDRNSSSVTLVANLAYSYGQSLIEAYRMLIDLSGHRSNLTIRLRIRQKSTGSSLAVYESTHTYCPDPSIIIVSRLNVIVEPNFLAEVSLAINQKFHYYFPGNVSSKQIESIFSSKGERKDINNKQLANFLNLQIFKSNFMKMIHLWALSSDVNEFYETESSYILPLIEMSNYSILSVPNALYYLSGSRSMTSRENSQMDRIKSYSRWDKIANNQLKPIKYNSLTNLDLRRGALDLIPKKIHQVWLRNQPLPKSVISLQKTIKQANPEYNYTLWDLKALNPHDFPLSYGLLNRIFQHEYASGRSYHPWAQALFSYQVLYNQGGIYLTLKAQGKKPLDPFLKYEIFFAGFYNSVGNYDYPVTVGRQVMGAKKHSYHLRLALAELVTIQSIDFSLNDYQGIVGGDVLRASLTNNQLFTTIGFGFNLFTYDPYRTKQDPCDNTIPCRSHPEAYIILHHLI